MSNTSDEQASAGDALWTPATPDELKATLDAGGTGSPGDWQARLDAALAALRGWSVIRGVSVSHGEVKIRYPNLHMSGKSFIEHSRVLTPGPVIVIADSLERVTGNEGDAIQGIVIRDVQAHPE